MRLLVGGSVECGCWWEDLLSEVVGGRICGVWLLVGGSVECGCWWEDLLSVVVGGRIC